MYLLLIIFVKLVFNCKMKDMNVLVCFFFYLKGKLSKRGKEYRKVEEYRATCVHPAWLKACYKFRQRVAEKLYATTYNPNRSLV